MNPQSGGGPLLLRRLVTSTPAKTLDDEAASALLRYTGIRAAGPAATPDMR